MLRRGRSKKRRTFTIKHASGEIVSTSESDAWSNERLFDYHVSATLLKADGKWLSRIDKLGHIKTIPEGGLEDIVMASKECISGKLPITLAHAEYRYALMGVDVHVRTHVGQKIESEELLTIIDTVVNPWKLDLSDCQIRDSDLGAQWISERYESDPDAERGAAPIWQSTYTGGLDLSGTKLSKSWLTRLKLNRSDLHHTSFDGASLDDVDLSETRAGGAAFSSASLHRVVFRRAELMSADFSSAKLLECNFEDTYMPMSDWRGATVIRGTFARARLANARLEGVDFSAVNEGGLHGVQWSEAHLDRTRLRRDQLGEKLAQEIEAESGLRVWATREEPYLEFRLPPDYRPDAFRIARDEYAIHKNNFASIGRYADSSWAYYKERTMERKRLLWSFWIEPYERKRDLWAWILNWVEFLLTGYGERPWRAAGASAVTILIFAFLYQWWDLVEFNSACQKGWECHEFVGHLLYSGAAFVAVGSSVARVNSRLGEVVTILEAGMGIALFALLLFTLGNRISRS